MILQCPSCQARFVVPDAAIPPEGRTVKCGKCAHQWFATRPADLPPPAAAPVFADMAQEAFDKAGTETAFVPPSPVARVPARRPLRVPLLPFKIAVPVLASAWLVIALFAYFPHGQRAAVLSGIYSAFGVTDTSDLVFADVTMERQTDGSRTQFLLSGSIANHGAESRLLPKVRVQLKDEKGKVLWNRAYAVNETIAPGQVYPFRIDNVETSFANRATSIVLDLGNNFELVMR